MNPYVTTVSSLPEYRLLLGFENGEERIFDLTPYLDKGVFVSLKSPALFKRAQVVAGSVEWPGEIDLSYDTLYLGSQAVQRTHAA